jgi:hypothetical protein
MSNQDKMSNLDKAIYQSLSKEDQDFLARLDEEPQFLKQFTGVYKGGLGIINWIVTIGLISWAVVGIFALIRFFNVSPDIEGMLKWGGLTALSVGICLFFRIWLGMHMQTNRVLRELKKLELQIASLKQNQS